MLAGGATASKEKTPAKGKRFARRPFVGPEGPTHKAADGVVCAVMKGSTTSLRLSATDLSNHLACRHLTSLDLGVVRGMRKAPEWRAPDLVIIQELGLRHEAAYLDFLRNTGITVIDLRSIENETESLLETRNCMKAGVELIAQGTLQAGRWFGRPDVLRKVLKPSRLGEWSYEAYDCKLACETKATTILQLALYSALLAEIQGSGPEFMHVVPPGKNFEPESYRSAEYAAYYRYVRARLEKFCDDGQDDATYPEPCVHCEICRWFRECDGQRRDDDHLSLVAGITRLQRDQLERWDTRTMARLAAFPIPLREKPTHGSTEAYERVREQARVQVQGRAKEQPVHELLTVEKEKGLCKLPAPSRLDVFFDLESDAFAFDGGLQYLFGFVCKHPDGRFVYESKWSFTPAEERRAFEWAVDEIMRRWAEDSAMHVYHFGAHEPSTLKSLMGRYATREEEIDRMLRAGLFVDLHTICKQAVRASVEEYSLKALEIFHRFTRNVPLSDAGTARRQIEHWLELESEDVLPEKLKARVGGYNEDDCRSTAALRDWLEGERRKIEERGTSVPRPEAQDGAPSEELNERQKLVAAVVGQLCADVPDNLEERSDEQTARWMLAQLLDWHRRENKATWWEGFRLADLDDEELLDERAGLAGLRFVERLEVKRQIPTDRYAFEKQETEIRSGDDLYRERRKFGSVVAIDALNHTVDIKKTKKTAELHPSGVYAWERPVNTDKHANALLRIGEWVRDNGVDAAGPFRAARDLLLRKAPRLTTGAVRAKLGERALDAARRVAANLDQSVFAIQGPPGSGKTYSGARMICALAKQGKKIGITALSHKVIRKMLEEVVEAAGEEKIAGIRCMQRSDDEEPTPEIAIAQDNDEAIEALRSGRASVLGGTSWLWTEPDAFEALDVLFIDEAGQMALADVIAVSQAAKNLVLIGDPQQLERPLKGSHPPGAEKSAMEHLLGEHKTIPDEMGLLLPTTHRMHPKICAFTSELFYEGRLSAEDLTRPRVIEGHPWLSGAGLWFVPVAHQGNRNSSAEEVEAVAKIVESLRQPGVVWFRSTGNCSPLKLEQILVVAPYNAQVFDLLTRLPKGVPVGTVDKFQGQQAPVVIYSLTTSSPEDAPRGMEFLYSLNRLNVATSRGMSTVIVVGNPRLFEPDCRNPRQMQLANAFCRFAEMATTVELLP
jgi:predicted RecB family nuclease